MEMVSKLETEEKQLTSTSICSFVKINENKRPQETAAKSPATSSLQKPAAPLKLKKIKLAKPPNKTRVNSK